MTPVGSAQQLTSTATATADGGGGDTQAQVRLGRQVTQSFCELHGLSLAGQVAYQP
jgi:hypothetical protein